MLETIAKLQKEKPDFVALWCESEGSLDLDFMVDTFGTGKLPREKLTQLVRRFFDLTPYGLREMLDLARPIYFRTAAYGHFGREEADFTWERTDRAAALAAEAGARVRAA